MTEQPLLRGLHPALRTRSEERRLPLRCAKAAREYLAQLRAWLAETARARRRLRSQLVNQAHSDADRPADPSLVRARTRSRSFTYYSDEGEFDATVSAILAVGGFARREMSIGSDVDLLFLHRWQGDQPPTLPTRVAEWIQYCLWDAGVDRGLPPLRNIGRVRSPSACEDADGRGRAILGRSLPVPGTATLFHEFTDGIRPGASGP